MVFTWLIMMICTCSILSILSILSIFSIISVLYFTVVGDSISPILYSMSFDNYPIVGVAVDFVWGDMGCCSGGSYDGWIKERVLNYVASCGWGWSKGRRDGVMLIGGLM